jgi:hypothetical protein
VGNLLFRAHLSIIVPNLKNRLQKREEQNKLEKRQAIKLKSKKSLNKNKFLLSFFAP